MPLGISGMQHIFLQNLAFQKSQCGELLIVFSYDLEVLKEDFLDVLLLMLSKSAHCKVVF